MQETTIKKSLRKLPVRLSDDEVRLRGIDLANAVKDHLDLDEERKRVAKEYKERMEAIDESIRELKDQTRNAVEVRLVEVELVIDNYMGSVKITRTDTGEIVEQRMMNAEEQQGKFDFPDGEEQP